MECWTLFYVAWVWPPLCFEPNPASKYDQRKVGGKGIYYGYRNEHIVINRWHINNIGGQVM